MSGEVSKEAEVLTFLQLFVIVKMDTWSIYYRKRLTLILNFLLLRWA